MYIRIPKQYLLIWLEVDKHDSYGNHSRDYYVNTYHMTAHKMLALSWHYIGGKVMWFRPSEGIPNYSSLF